MQRSNYRFKFTSQKICRVSNKYFIPPQAKGFYKNREAFFAFCDAILGINNTSQVKQYTMDE